MTNVESAKPPASDADNSIENYKQLLETLNVVPWEYHWKSGTFLYMGPQASMFGYPINDWYEEGFLAKVIHPDDLDKAMKYCDTAVECRQDYEYEYRLIKANGEYCWVRKIVRFSSDHDDAAVLRGVFVDITVQKQAKDDLLVQNNELRQRDIELSKKNEQFNAAIDCMSRGLSMFDCKRQLIVCNSQFSLMYNLPPELARPGTSLDQIIEHRITSGIFSGAGHQDYVEKCITAIERKEPTLIVQELKSGDFIETSYLPMASGGWLSTHEDISERKRAEKALQESQEFLSIVFRSSPVAIAISVPEDGELIEVNEAWLKMLGYSHEEALASSATKLGVWLDEKSRKKFVNQIADKGAARGYETKFKTKGGRELDVMLSGETTDINGRQRLLAVSHDITNRKRTERELIAHRDHLQELVDAATRELKGKAEELEIALSKERDLSELQRQFVSMASHEFRTPLAIIDGTTQRLIKLMGRNDLTPEDAIERFGKIRASVQRMTKLMEGTLTAARLEEGKIHVEIGPCQIGKTIIDVCLRQQEISANHVISCNLIDLPDIIQADTGALEQVLTNLLSNAEKYAPNAPEIDVKAYREGENIIISVSDQGLGIDEDELDKIGERFFRAKTSAGIPGTGIGLNIAKKLVEMHGGSIHVESQKVVGSTFFVTIPIMGPEQSGQSKAKVA